MTFSLDRHRRRTGGEASRSFVGFPRNVTRMEELSCFVPGNLALGIMTGAVSGERAARYAAAAKNLTYTCWQMYQRMPTGTSQLHVLCAAPS